MRRHRYLGWIISTLALCVCISIRFYVDRYGQFLGSGALMPAIMIAGLFGGVGAGVIVLAVSTFVLFFFFVPPYLTFEFGRPGDAVNLLLFVITGATALYLIRTLNRAVDVAHRRGAEAGIMHESTGTLFPDLQHRFATNLAFPTAVIELHARKINKGRPTAAALEAIRERLMAMTRSH